MGDREYGLLFDAFGLTVSRSGSTPTPFGFAGRAGYQGDADTGLLLLGHRYYDPSTGRFLSQDPAQAGDNWYAYCSNDPLGKVDPKGLVGFITGIDGGIYAGPWGVTWGVTVGIDTDGTIATEGSAGTAAGGCAVGPHGGLNGGLTFGVGPNYPVDPDGFGQWNETNTGVIGGPVQIMTPVGDGPGFNPGPPTITYHPDPIIGVTPVTEQNVGVSGNVPGYIHNIVNTIVQGIENLCPQPND